MRPRTRVASALASSVAGAMAARPLGSLAQKYFTTLPDLADVRILEVRTRNLLGRRVVETLTGSVER